MKKLRTIQKEVVLSGVGIHSGAKVDLHLKPSDSGRVVFLRTDLNGLEFHMDPCNVEVKNSTILKGKGQKIQTIEHLMASLYIFGIDSLLISLNAIEIPILDGSALPFVDALFDAGFEELSEEKKTIRIRKPFVVEDKNGAVYVEPDKNLRITYFIDYPHPLIQKQNLSVLVTKKHFVQEIAPARTFGFLKDVIALRAQGLALGGSLKNAIVLDDTGIINGPLRFPDEFVRHKILDFVGDLSIMGFPIIGHFRAERAGHPLHIKTVRFLLEHPKYWEFVSEIESPYD
ncbi:MAG: UDP-3-O-[3-hydroxymyristoyl] N-acetylglucosamine deacetylase [Candidatus Aminicenantes bacterium]|nr:UDP-3-O-[3-hydroxymyristoyl] N-acetylglucosamine deacetylase [Candidatus Aminicenantes bacterium]